jgi:hypothetical protein
MDTAIERRSELSGGTSDEPAPCIRCRQARGSHTQGVLRSRGRASATAFELRGAICDGCIEFLTYCGRSTGERLMVRRPSPEALLEILKNGMLFVGVITQSARSLSFDGERRSAFETLLATSDDAALGTLFQRLEMEIVDRHPQAEEVKTLVRAAGMLGERAGTSYPNPLLTSALELLTVVDDAGLGEIQESLTKLALDSLRRTGRVFGPVGSQTPRALSRL